MFQTPERNKASFSTHCKDAFHLLRSGTSLGFYQAVSFLCPLLTQKQQHWHNASGHKGNAFKSSSVLLISCALMKIPVTKTSAACVAGSHTFCCNAMAWRRVTPQADSDTAEQRCLNIRAAHTELKRIVQQHVLNVHLLYIAKTSMYIYCIAVLNEPSAHSAGAIKASEQHISIIIMMSVSR